MRQKKLLSYRKEREANHRVEKSQSATTVFVEREMDLVEKAGAMSQGEPGREEGGLAQNGKIQKNREWSAKVA